MIVQRSVPWTRQPQVAVGVDWRNPLARGLVGLWTPEKARMLDVVGGLHSVQTSTSTPDVNARIGAVLRNSSTANNAGQTSYASSIAPTSEMTALVFGRRTTSGTNIGTETTNAGWGFGYSTGAMPGRVYLRVGAAWADQDCGIADQETALWGFSFNGSLFRALKNGAQVASQAISGAITQSTAGIVFGGFALSGANNSTPQIGVFLLWNRALADAEIAAVSANPWQLFAPQRRFYPVAAGAPGIPVLSGLTFIDITATTARPRVTLTF